MKTIKKRTRVNKEIRAKQVRLIDSDGTRIGVISLKDALKTAESRALDLVEVSPNANPPVCKILDFGKYKFEQAKKLKESKKKQKTIETKEIRFRPKIEEHDYITKLNQVKKFLEKGKKVKLSVRFRGREMAHTDKGKEVLNRLVQDVNGMGAADHKPRFEGRVITVMLSPVKKSKSKKDQQ
ncbi:MAG: translation initiation factor IF-3 [Spirochaetota bacterium]